VTVDQRRLRIGDALGADLATAALVIAQRMAGGATMWCLAPAWPEHGRHMAVEFVHPVVVGKRALPSLFVEGPAPLARLRTLVRPGDVLVGIDAGTSEVVQSAMRRAPVWGMTTVWIGAGTRPAPGSADHVLFVDDTGLARHDGSVVLLYHVLWELTHVCFEHPGLLAVAEEPAPQDDPASDDESLVCITCADEGRAAEVVSAEGPDRAIVRTAEGVETIDTSLVGPLAHGDLVLVHAGAAIASLEGPGDG
jgi:hypothetical protein